MARFFALCHAILRRRINDHFRSRATLWIERSAGSPAEQPELASESAELDRGLELRRALAQLLSTVERLPKQEQQLLERAALGDSLGPLSAADRQRLHRLRTRLAAELESTVGANPLEVLGRR